MFNNIEDLEKMFGLKGINKEIEEAQERWKKIDVLADALKIAADDKQARITAEIVLLLVEQLRPAYSPEEIGKSMAKMFTGGTEDDNK